MGSQTPIVQANGDPITFDGRQVGRYGVDAKGYIVALFYKPRFRIHDSYAMSCELYKEVDDVSWFYILDTDDDGLYRFKPETYYDAPIVYGNGQRQFAPDRDQHDDYWPNGQDLIQ